MRNKSIDTLTREQARAFLLDVNELVYKILASRRHKKKYPHQLEVYRSLIRIRNDIDIFSEYITETW